MPSPVAAPRPRVLLRLPHLYPKQRAFVECRSKFTVCFASTKAGKTVGMIIRMLGDMWVRGAPGRDWYWYAPSYGVAQIAYRRLQRWLLKMDPEARTWRKNDSETFIELSNGARAIFKGAERPDLLYGPDAWGVIIDEGTRCREELRDVAVSVTTATDGWIAIIGNMKSRGHWMYKLWLKGKQGDQDITSMKLDAWDAVEGGVLKRSVVEQAQRQLPAHVFKALYLAEPVDTGTNPFGLDAIERAAGAGAVTEVRKIDAAGVDLAKSIDWTVVLGLDAYGACGLFERWQAPWDTTIPRIRRLIHRIPTLVDSTGVGDPILEQLQKGRTGVRGYKFTNASKQVLMEGLAVALQQDELHDLPEEVTNELEIFEFEYTATGVRYSAPEGMHDDTVCALAMAVHQQGKRRRRYSGATLPVGGDVASPYSNAVA